MSHGIEVMLEAFDHTFPTSHLFHRLGYVRADVFDEVFTGLLRCLGYFQ
jgi:hypothetical protein